MMIINDDIIIYIHRRAFLEVKKESTRTVFHIWDLNSLSRALNTPMMTF